MAHNRVLSPRFLVFLPLLAVLIIGLACGADEETPTHPAHRNARSGRDANVIAIAHSGCRLRVETAHVGQQWKVRWCAAHVVPELAYKLGPSPADRSA